MLPNRAHTFRAMNTECSTAGLSSSAQRRVEAWFTYVEQKASRFRPDSELMQINQSQAPLYFVSLLIYQLLQEAETYFRRTDGVFSPYLGRCIHALGYTKSFENIPQVTSATIVDLNLNEEKTYCHTKQIYTRRNSRSYPPIQIDGDAWIDLGGIAKGWSVQTMGEWLQKEGQAEGVLNAGGDLLAWRSEESREPWTVHLLAPHTGDRAIARLEMRSGRTALATSSTQKRRWRKATGEVVHHIIDPRIHQSSASDIVQASVLLPDLTAAEVYAKCLIILGMQRGITWLRKEKPEAAYILVKKDGTVERSANLDTYCTEYEVSKHVECF
ncbi:FAD:protein FMN transferase [Aneurinibacillus sp. REN35]|uniref:FAD:protein FMN transferase n=1 Tax=Aneurinibacillus sp. REN35 TaxID=3237286 RepID=UPI003527F737